MCNSKLISSHNKCLPPCQSSVRTRQNNNIPVRFWYVLVQIVAEYDFCAFQTFGAVLNVMAWHSTPVWRVITACQVRVEPRSVVRCQEFNAWAPFGFTCGWQDWITYLTQAQVRTFRFEYWHLQLFHIHACTTSPGIIRFGFLYCFENRLIVDIILLGFPPIQHLHMYYLRIHEWRVLSWSVFWMRYVCLYRDVWE